MRLTPRQKEVVTIFKNDPETIIILVCAVSREHMTPYYGHIFDKNKQRIRGLNYRTFDCLLSKGILIKKTLEKYITLESKQFRFGSKYVREMYILNPEHKIK